MRFSPALLVLTLALGGESVLAKPCGFAAGARLAEPDGAGVREASIHKEWRGMMDEFWVSSRVKATFPHFPDTTTPVAAKINRIVRAFVDSGLEPIGCPEDAKLPAKGRRLVSISSHASVRCEVSYFSAAFVSIACSAEGRPWFSALSGTNREVFNLRIDGRSIHRTRGNDLYLPGGGLESLKRALREEIERADREAGRDQPDAAVSEDVAGLLSDPLFTADGIQFRYLDYRDGYELFLPYPKLRGAIRPSVWKRIMDHPSKVRRNE